MSPNNKLTKQIRRRGISLAELMVASVVLTLLMGGIAALTSGVQATNDFNRRTALVTQHGRVAMERIERAMDSAYGNETFPGLVSFSGTVGIYKFPDTVVVWRPTSGTPANPTGLPLVSELVVFCPSPSALNNLVEITRPADSATVPALSNTAAWTTLLNTFKTDTSTATTTKVITNLLRVSSVSYGSGPTSLKGNARFEVTLAPTDANWASYKAGTTTWSALLWPLDQYSTNQGTRMVNCRIELQLLPGDDAATIDPSGNNAVPFFGSSSIYFQLTR